VTSLLASFPSPPQGVWHLGWLPIRAYAFFIIVGIVVAMLIGDRRWVARGGQSGIIYDIALWAVPFGLIGGRLYHVMTDWRTYFGDGGAGFLAALKIWDGGLGIWGAVALGGVGAWIACRRHGIPLPAFGDAIAPGIILAQAIGRLGNYFNQELYGRETTVPWGMKIYERRDASGALDSLNGVSDGQVLGVVHPTFLYELLWNLLVFAMLIWADRRFKLGHGRLFALYVAGYCVGRFWVELMRSDAATHIAGIRINSFTSTFVFIGAVVYIILAPKGREDPATLGGARAEEEVAAKTPVAEVAKELTAVAATSGVVAAATVAGAEEETETTTQGGEGEEPPEDVEAETAESEEAEAEEQPVEEAAEAEPEELEETEPESAESEVEEREEMAEVAVAPQEAAEAEREEAEETEPESADAAEEQPEAAEPETAESEVEQAQAETAAEVEAPETDEPTEGEEAEPVAEAAAELTHEGVEADEEVEEPVEASAEPGGEVESEKADETPEEEGEQSEAVGEEAEAEETTRAQAAEPATEAAEPRRWWRRLARRR
jgi:prolipoprotein diacylglyceryl transferase